MVKVKCSHCGYEWFTSSVKMYIGCPNCMVKSKREEAIIIDGYLDPHTESKIEKQVTKLMLLAIEQCKNNDCDKFKHPDRDIACMGCEKVMLEVLGIKEA
jgi:ribosomal protein S27E